eukprot:1080474-Prorocentrum_lima.AAC.1
MKINVIMLGVGTTYLGVLVDGVLILVALTIEPLLYLGVIPPAAALRLRGACVIALLNRIGSGRSAVSW